MPNVRVWNDNTYPFSQEFKGEKITIGPRQFKVMEYYEAMEFKSAFSPIERDGDGQALPRSYKMIRVEQPAGGAEDFDETEDDKKFVCHATGVKYATQAEADAENKKHEHLVVKDEEAEKELAQERRGRGRPPKAKELAT